jgi:hypothetical protein
MAARCNSFCQPVGSVGLNLKVSRVVRSSRCREAAFSISGFFFGFFFGRGFAFGLFFFFDATIAPNGRIAGLGLLSTVARLPFLSVLLKSICSCGARSRNPRRREASNYRTKRLQQSINPRGGTHVSWRHAQRCSPAIHKHLLFAQPGHDRGRIGTRWQSKHHAATAFFR